MRARAKVIQVIVIAGFAVMVAWLVWQRPGTLLLWTRVLFVELRARARRFIGTLSGT